MKATEMNNTNFGWVHNPEEVERVLSTMPMPIMTAPPTGDEKTEVFLYTFMRAITKGDAPKGPQKIGDCVSWGWSNLTNYIAALQIFKALKAQNLLDATGVPISSDESQAVIEQYQPAASEVTYALSRVEVGGQRGSYDDGSVGAWAAKSVTDFGTLSRPYLESKLGPGKGAYDPNRAKDWGAKGLPDELEPDARQHVIKTTTLVQSFNDAAKLIQNGYPVAVCSNRGFTMTRDRQGFCTPSGVWNHCMLFVAVRWDRPGLCCSQSWGPNTPSGPVDKDQPDNTFWVDANVVDYMLGQRDSFTGSEFHGYPDQDFIDWRF